MHMDFKLSWKGIVCLFLVMVSSYTWGGDYIIGPEDIIEVNIWKEPDLSRTVLVRPDGKISLPLVGDIKAMGITPTQLAQAIEKKLSEYIESPVVSVILTGINNPKIYILGRVNKPGMYPLRDRITLLQAIALAGGFAEWAKKSKVIILRQTGDKDQRLVINIDKIIKGKKGIHDIILQRGDRIIVP